MRGRIPSITSTGRIIVVSVHTSLPHSQPRQHRQQQQRREGEDEEEGEGGKRIRGRGRASVAYRPTRLYTPGDL